MQRIVRLAIALACLTATSLAHASPESERAEALYEKGKDAMAHDDLATACTAFAESLKLENAVGTLLNLGTCEERSGRLVAALDHFTTARGMLSNDDFRVPFATERIREVSKRVAHLTIRPRAPDADLRITTDGVALPSSQWSVARAVDPGPHVIVIEREGRPPAKIDVRLADGEVKVVDLEADRVSAPSSGSDSSARTRTDESSGPTPLAYLLGSVGLAGIATGSVTGILAMDAASDYRAHCTNGECDPQGLDAASNGRTMSVISPIAFAVGAVALGAGIYLFFATRH